MNLQNSANNLPARLLGLVYSAGCYLVFLVTFLYPL
jgi:methanethiol S-methyltransferase